MKLYAQKSSTGDDDQLFGIYELPKFQSKPFWLRETLGGWQLNGVFRAENGSLISAPSSVNIIGSVNQPNPTYARYFNTCYENTSGVLVSTTSQAPGCDTLSPMPAYEERPNFTSQTNSNVINVRTRVYPLMDASLFKRFAITATTTLKFVANSSTSSIRPSSTAREPASAVQLSASSP